MGEVVKIFDRMTQSQLTIQSDERFNKFSSKTFTREKSSNFLCLKHLLSVSDSQKKASRISDNYTKSLVIFELFQAVKSLYRTILGISRRCAALINVKQIIQGKERFKGKQEDRNKVLKTLIFSGETVFHIKRRRCHIAPRRILQMDWQVNTVLLPF